jgi:hypothetical protein
MKDSGVYYLQIRGTTYWFLKVYCEQEVAEGGWTVSNKQACVHLLVANASRYSFTELPDLCPPGEVTDCIFEGRRTHDDNSAVSEKIDKSKLEFHAK